MEKIRKRRISKTNVQAGVTAGRQYLTGLDIFGGMVTVPLFYMYPQGLDPEAMERSLAVTLRRYPLVAGRLKKDAEGYPYIDADDSGVPFEVYDVDGPMPAYGPDYPHQSFIGQYYDKVFPWTIYRKDTPLFGVKVFRFADGGAICTMAPVHCLIDGSSVWMFVQDWARAARGEELAPVVERDFLLERSQQYSGHLYGRREVMTLGRWQRLGLYARLAWQVIGNRLEVHRIPGRYLDHLRADYEKACPDGPRVSDADLITARCLKEIGRVQGYRRDLHVGMVVDFRFKRGLDIPRRLFGLAIGQEERAFSARDLQECSVPDLTMKLRHPEDPPRTEDWRGYLGFMERQRQQKTLGSVIPRSVVRGLEGGFMQNNYCAMPVYDADLGTGQPTWYTPTAAPFRMVKIVPTAGDDNTVDLHLILSRRELRAFRTLFGRL